MAVVDSAMEHAQKTQRDAARQHGLFGVFQQEESASGETAAQHSRLGRALAARAEKEILGFFITGHPLEKYREKLLDLHALSTTEVARSRSRPAKTKTITTAGILKSPRAESKKGDLYAQGRWKT